MQIFNSTGAAKSRYMPGGMRKSSWYKKKTVFYRKKTKFSNKKKGYKGKYKSSKSNIKNSNNVKALANKILDSQLKVYRYPFSTATRFPKIPDGKLKFSIGCSFNFSKQFSSTSSSMTNSDFNNYYVILFPGITSNVVVFDKDQKVLAQSHFTQFFLPHYDFTQFSLKYDQVGYSGYRYVSCGMRIGVETGGYDNAGYWEALYLPISSVKDQFTIDLLQVVGEAPNATNIPAGDGTLGLVSPVHTLEHSFRNDAIIQSGSLKDLGNHEFRLRDNCIDHNFVDVPREVQVGNFTKDGIDDTFDGLMQYDEFNFMADRQFDMIMVKLSIPAALSLNMSLHSVANIECRPDSNVYTGLSTACVSNSKRLLAVQRAQERENRLPGVLKKEVFAKLHSKKSY